MEHRNTLSAAKLIAGILIVSLLVESIAAAPLADNQQQQQQQASKKELNVSREKVPKSMHRSLKRGGKMFSQTDYMAWTNPCGANSYIELDSSGQPNGVKVDIGLAYNHVKDSVDELKNQLISNNKINVTNYEAWDEFNARSYEFLPTRPTGDHRKWHFDLQIYVASLGLLHKEQLRQDKTELFNMTISTELHIIFNAARRLLCEIENFVNTTSSQKIGSEDWISKREMRQLLKFENLTDMIKLHQIYVKGRLQGYVAKLLRRISDQSQGSYVEKITHQKHKSLALRKKKTVTRRPQKPTRRVNINARPQAQPLNGDTYEMSTKRVHIVRTSKTPGRNNRINGGSKGVNARRRQRTEKAKLLQAERQKQQQPKKP